MHAVTMIVHVAATASAAASTAFGVRRADLKLQWFRLLGERRGNGSADGEDGDDERQFHDE